MAKLAEHIPSRRYQPQFNIVRTGQSIRTTPAQVLNNQGGYVFSTGPFEAMNRFLILGVDGGTMYASEKSLTIDSCKEIDECLKLNHEQTVDIIVERGKNAPKMEPIVLAYARACATGRPAERHYALSKLREVCRIPTHLFLFMEYSVKLRGTGTGFRKAVANWYQSEDPKKLAYQVTKYNQRDGWSHRDVLRLAHPTPKNETEKSLFQYLVKGDFEYVKLGRMPEALEYLNIVKRVKKSDSVKEVTALVREHRLPREVLPTEMLNSPKVWEALLDAGMPMTALIRNLGKLSSIGLLSKQDKDVTKAVCDQLTNIDHLRKARIHPIAMLNAMRVYANGHGEKGSLTWTPVDQVTEALELGFYRSFDTIEPSNAAIMLCLDVSGSMGGGKVSGCNMTPREASAVIAMATLRSEPNSSMFAFSQGFIPLSINPQWRLDHVIRYLSQFPFQGTDCAQPALYATRKGLKVDGIVIYTDSETAHGDVHPYRAIEQYRQRVNSQCRQIVVAMTGTHFTIADPRDALSMDVVGMGVDTPAAISRFISLS